MEVIGSNNLALTIAIVLAYVLVVIVAARDHLKKEGLSILNTWDSEPE